MVTIKMKGQVKGKMGSARGYAIADEANAVAQHSHGDNKVAGSTHARVDGAVERGFNKAQKAV